ncbi:MAG TPA: YciI family protein [Polyangiales bacterium]|nr:YciI family protein [Polyangiales bacterium]
MKAIVIGKGSGAAMSAIMAVYPRHKAVVDAFIERGEVIGIGPFGDASGSLAIFRSRVAAEAFVKQDPFILEGLIASYEIHDWRDDLLS